MNAESPYRAIAGASLSRLWQAIDLDPASPTVGEVDRLHWAWGARDSANADLQRAAGILAGAVRLGLVSASQVETAQALIVRRWCRLQHADGTFDQWFPGEHSLGTAAFTLAEMIPAAGSLSADPQFRSAVRRAADAIVSGEESHGFISNHRGGMALALLRASRLLEDPALAQRAEELIAGILERQSPEGWFAEYDGADPGYETLGLSYLAQCWQVTGDPAILAACRRSLAFLCEVQHPDGSLGGDYGSRGVALIFPAGLEILAPHSEDARRLAAGARSAFVSGRTPSPADTDDANFIAVFSNVVTAALHAASLGLEPLKSLPQDAGWRWFPGAGLIRARVRDHFVLASTQRLGAGVFYKGQEARHQSGYVGRWENRTIASTVAASPATCRVETDDVILEGVLHAVPLLPATPFRHLLLRAAFACAAVLPGLRAVIKRQLAARLIAGRRPVSIRLARTIRLGEGITIEDRLTNDSPYPVVIAPVERCVPFYMGSARYRSLADGCRLSEEITLAAGTTQAFRFEF